MPDDGSGNTQCCSTAETKWMWNASLLLRHPRRAVQAFPEFGVVELFVRFSVTKGSQNRNTLPHRHTAAMLLLSKSTGQVSTWLLEDPPDHLMPKAPCLLEGCFSTSWLTCKCPQCLFLSKTFCIDAASISCGIFYCRGLSGVQVLM